METTDVKTLQEAAEAAKAEYNKIIAEIAKKITERKNSNADMRQADFLVNLRRLKDEAKTYSSLYVTLREALPNDVKFPNYDETLDLALAVAAEISKKKQETNNETEIQKPKTRTRRTKANE